MEAFAEFERLLYPSSRVPDVSPLAYIGKCAVKALVNKGCKSRPGTGSLRPVATGAVVEVTKPLKPLA